MSPRQRVELFGHHGLVWALTIIDTFCAWYFLTRSVATFRQSPTWDGVLNLTGSLNWLGLLFLAVAVIAWAGILGVPWAARIGLCLAALPWGAVVTSFAYAALTLNGLGALLAVLAALTGLLHLASVGHYAPGGRP